jgi:PAT family beta-lactamase induction signal transducer AmpG
MHDSRCFNHADDSEPIVAEGRPETLKDAIIAPLVEYFNRKEAVWILIFILLYKIGDTMATAMTIPFYLDIGFSKTEIGTVVKLYGFWPPYVAPSSVV